MCACTATDLHDLPQPDAGHGQEYRVVSGVNPLVEALVMIVIDHHEHHLGTEVLRDSKDDLVGGGRHVNTSHNGDQVVQLLPQPSKRTLIEGAERTDRWNS